MNTHVLTGSHLPRMATAILACTALLALSIGHPAHASVGMVKFEATAQPNGTIVVEWETATELNTIAFQLYRARSANPTDWGDPVDEQRARGDNVIGATYTFTDRDITSGVRYYYLLEDISTDNSGGRYGPITAGLNLPTDTPTSTAPPTNTPLPPTATSAPTATTPPVATSAPTATKQPSNTPRPSATDAQSPAPDSTPGQQGEAEEPGPEPSGGDLTATSSTAQAGETPGVTADASAQGAAAATQESALAPDASRTAQASDSLSTEGAILESQAPDSDDLALEDRARSARIALILGSILLAGSLVGGGILLRVRRQRNQGDEA